MTAKILGPLSATAAAELRELAKVIEVDLADPCRRHWVSGVCTECIVEARALGLSYDPLQPEGLRAIGAWGRAPSGWRPEGEPGEPEPVELPRLANVADDDTEGGEYS